MTVPPSIPGWTNGLPGDWNCDNSRNAPIPHGDVQYVDLGLQQHRWIRERRGLRLLDRSVRDVHRCSARLLTQAQRTQG